MSPFVESLDRFTPEQQAFLLRRVRLNAPDLRVITKEELPLFFGQKAGINESAFILTYVFQYFVRLLDELDKPIGGNIRSFWYQRLRRDVERLGLLQPVGGLSVARTGSKSRPFLKLMENAIETLFRQEFYRYRDLGVHNHRDAFQWLGRENRRHLFYIEKEGLKDYCIQAHANHSLHAYASRGSASWLDVDYHAAAIRNLDVRSLSIGALTDHDPWGLFIAQQIKKKFQYPLFGFRTIRMQHLTTLDLFDPEVIELNKRNLLIGHEDPRDPVHQVVMQWVKQGGGINGEPYGIHLDSANPELVTRRIERWLKGTWQAQAIKLEPPSSLRKRLEKQLGVALS